MSETAPSETTPSETAPSGPRFRHEVRLSVIAASAALLGALVGGFAAFGASVYQAGAERQLAVRQARQEAYAAMNLALDEVIDDIAILKESGSSDDAARTAIDAVCAASDKLRRPLATVQIIASDEVGQAASDAYEAGAEYCRQVRSTGKYVDHFAFARRWFNFTQAARAEVT